MRVIASRLPLIEIAFVLVRFYHIASVVVNANHNVLWMAVECAYLIAVGSTEWRLSEAAFVFALADIKYWERLSPTILRKPIGGPNHRLCCANNLALLMHAVVAINF
jgi:hypothetical protein